MKLYNKHILFIVLAIFSIIIIINGLKQHVLFSANKKTANNTKVIRKNKFLINDTIITINNHKIIIKVTYKEKKGCFLLLHGWNLPAEDWCNKTTLCNKILEKGYDIILPDMGKSVYQEKNYPETRNEWKQFPTRKWLSDTIIPLLQKEFSLLLENDNNYVVGLSTGARGVALLLLDFPYLFKGAAALSGDYAQEKMPSDNLMKGFYGEYEDYKERWETIDNPVYRIKEYKTPIYLAHGKFDNIVTPEQTLMFYDSLKKYHPDLKMKLNISDARHDYTFWDSETENILKFFELK